MKLDLAFKKPLRIMTILLSFSFYSLSSFAVTDDESKKTDRVLALETLPTSNADVARLLSKDCVSCAPDIAPGHPLIGNRSVRAINMVSNKAMSQEESAFFEYLFTYCMGVSQLRTEKDFKKKMLDSMKDTAINGNVDRYWKEAGCEPKYIGQTMSPLVHVMAENSTDRMQYMVYLKKYYVAKNDIATFKKIINAKNTQGQTVLDYIQYALKNMNFVKEEEKGLNEFVKFLCENGAEFSKNPGRKCPVDYISI